MSEVHRSSTYRVEVKGMPNEAAWMEAERLHQEFIEALGRLQAGVEEVKQECIHNNDGYLDVIEMWHCKDCHTSLFDIYKDHLEKLWVALHEIEEIADDAIGDTTKSRVAVAVIGSIIRKTRGE